MLINITTWHKHNDLHYTCQVLTPEKMPVILRLEHMTVANSHLLTGGGGCGGGGCIWGAGGAMKPGIGGAGAATGNGGRAGTEYINRN